MIIATWNSNRGKRSDKIPNLDQFTPTLSVLQEVGKPENESPRELWIGQNEKQGISVSVPEGATLKLHSDYDEQLHFALPAEVDDRFHVLGIWVKEEPKYVSNMLAILDHYEPFIREKPTIVAGDFNANPVFDASNSKKNHFRHIEDRMAELNLISAYHQFNGESFGAELSPTIYWMWKEQKPFHIDYVFIPEAWRSSIKSVEVGDYDSWKHLSDHRPMIVKLDPDLICE